MKTSDLFRIFVSFLPFVLGAVSCSDNTSPESELSLSMKVGKVGRDAGSAFVTVKASGDWTLSLTFQSSEEGEWASLSRTEGHGDAYDVILNYDSNETESERSLNIVLRSGNRSSEWILVQSDVSDPGIPGTDVIPEWMELPAVGADLQYFNHSFVMGGKTYRNYSFGWDQDKLAAHWVAYPLCGFYTVSNSGRTDAWAADPYLPENFQPIMYSGLGGGYDRGHQLPSADRTCDRVANEQTFYFTNMTPQLSGFNQKIWANLENRVRTISNRADTLYVVTGCVFGDGASFRKDNAGKNITVPTGYFKALLYYNRANTFGYAGYSAAAFFLEHRSYSQSDVDKSMAMSIDELESLTGLDFFVNLPSKTGESKAALIEAENPANVSIWW